MGTYGATTDFSGNFQARVDVGRYAMSVTRKESRGAGRARDKIFRAWNGLDEE